MSNLQYKRLWKTRVHTSSALTVAIIVLAILAIVLTAISVISLSGKAPDANRDAPGQAGIWDSTIAETRQLETAGRHLEGVRIMDDAAVRLEDVPREIRWRWCVRKAELWDQVSKLAKTAPDIQVARSKRDEMITAALKCSKLDNDPGGLEYSYAKLLEATFSHEDQESGP